MFASQPQTVLRLLETCRQIHAEAEDIFYQVNQIELSDLSMAHKFFRAISQTRRDAIRSIAFSAVSGDGVLTLIRVIAPASRRLRNLRIERGLCIFHMHRHSWTPFADDIVAALRELKELRGLEITAPGLSGKTPAEDRKRKEVKEIEDKVAASLGFR
ncbi:hypothetical protein NQ176_g11250 [Zarea fungicola]|uniref:Uncharacterized protein n=1 Tax=Zarea fungicola TaxID=93591 RepID=A0ACC1MCB1_9HYPO|nr:hypothetical protein NQ176_g11250 [Lecanicillium fungicola]